MRVNADLAALVEARRQEITAEAPCEGCGGTLDRCKAGKDLTAPPWFGCCARGTDMRPCNHVPDQGRLWALLREIERGEVAPVRTAEEKLLDSLEEHPRRKTGRHIQL
jgi:hypothetical protein